MKHSDTIEFGYLLIPQFSLLSLAGVLEPLRFANRLADHELYRWWLVTPDDQPVAASNGIIFQPTAQAAECSRFDTVIVVAGLDADKYSTPEVLRQLRNLAAKGLNIGATSVGSLLLARAGLLDSYRCTLHWENLEGFREEFPQINATNELYEIDGKRLTCSGGSAGLDMMMHLISQRHGYALATSVAEQCIHPEIRKSEANQRMSLRTRLNVTNPHLIEAIECMERHLEDTLECRQIAEQISLSLRHMNRLFQDNLRTTPARFYLSLRLKRARALLQQTAFPIHEIGLACGFASSSHFVRCYGNHFGHTPTAERHREQQRTPYRQESLTPSDIDYL
ncbi:GlxA family transcriptional regulator [Alcaligenaceae bacterium CGII-47]|nr:GlxA family transcriptional regulator [Alcaligenaceae bacterium CGII-47]